SLFFGPAPQGRPAFDESLMRELVDPCLCRIAGREDSAPNQCVESCASVGVTVCEFCLRAPGARDCRRNQRNENASGCLARSGGQASNNAIGMAREGTSYATNLLEG